MKLINLVSYFRLGGTFEDFCKEQVHNIESEVIEIYAQKPVCLDSQLGFFPIEETEGKIEILWLDRQYQNLFDFFYFLNMIEEIKGGPSPTDQELTSILLSYALNDA